MTGLIYLIRHSQASFGAENYDRLSEKGIFQADLLGRHLAALAVKFDILLYGEMNRQQETAEGVMAAYRRKGLPVPEPELDRHFNEYDAAAVWEAQVAQLLEEDSRILDPVKKNPQDNRAFQRVFARVVRRWVSGQYDAPGDVTWKAFKERVAGGLMSLVARAGSSRKIAVFSSAGPIAVMVQAAMELSDMKAIELSWQVLNASVTKLKYDQDQVTLAGFNDITHLELAGDKTLLTYR